MYRVATQVISPEAALPEGLRFPFGWSAKPVVPGNGNATELRWDSWNGLAADHARIRITIAVDVRENKRIELFGLNSGQIFGTMDIRYAHVFQLFEVPLSLSDALAAAREGIGLRLTEGKEPLWFFVPDSAGNLQEPLLLPHVMAPDGGSTVEAFKSRLQSLASIQQFGWMEGCVLDGLMDMGDRESVRKHAGMFLSSNNELVYEDPRSRPVDGAFYGIESTLPIAVLAKLEPSLPIVDEAVRFMAAHTDPEGIIKDGDTISAEGSYTIAYPLAVIANQREDRNLAEIALKQLLLRRDLLWHGGALFLRRQDNGARSFRNWGRAYAWHLLGLIRSLEQFREKRLIHADQERLLIEEFARTLRQAFSFRNEQGLWSCFLDDAVTGVDSSASAAIAAAAAIARRVGLDDYTGGADLSRLTDSLFRYLTPDGFMTGTSQSNKNGEELQRGGYRVISQMTMGLMGQLMAALDCNP